MTPLFKIIWAFWLLSEIALTKIYRTNKNRDKNWDKSSLILIWITITVAISLGVFATYYSKTMILNTSIINYSGLVLMIFGIVFRFIAIRTLGQFFTVNLNLAENHSLIKSGLYKYIRHPAYTGSLLSALGLAVSLNNLISLVVIFIPILFVFIYRINIEEKLLLTQFGDEYALYKKETKRLLPYIY